MKNLIMLGFKNHLSSQKLLFFLQIHRHSEHTLVVQITSIMDVVDSLV